MILRFQTHPARMLGGLAMLVLYPGFFFYHFGVALGWYGLFLGGMFGISLLALLPLLMIGTGSFIAYHPSIMRHPTTVMFVALVLWAVTWLGINVWIEPEHPGHSELATTVALWVGVFSVGLLLPLQSSFFKKAVWVVWAAMCALSFSVVDVGQLQTTVGQQSEGVATYQQLARSMVVVGIFVVATTPRMLIRIFVATVSIVALFLLGGRSELYGFVAAFAVTEYLVNRRSILGQAMLGLGIFAALVTAAANIRILQSSRQLEILNLAESTSWTAREYYRQNAVAQISESPLFGIYAGHLNFGNGGYSHNALSSWVSLGFPGFVFYVGLNILCFWISVRALAADPQSQSARMAAMLNLISLLLITLAKPVFWEMPALAWGTAIIATINWRPFPGHGRLVLSRL